MAFGQVIPKTSEADVWCVTSNIIFGSARLVALLSRSSLQTWAHESDVYEAVIRATYSYQNK